VKAFVKYSSAVSNSARFGQRGFTKEGVMRKALILALVSMFFAAMACNKSEETASPEASASAASEGAAPAAPAPEASAPAPAGGGASPAAPAGS
jgi:hypothetical protein